MSGTPRILAVHAGALGDFIVALPALSRLAAVGDLTIMGHGERIALAPLAMPRAHVLSIETADFHSLFATPSPRWLETACSFDAALVWFRDEDGAIARGMKTAGIATVWTAPGLPQADWPRHATDYYHACVDSLLEALGIDALLVPRPAAPELTVAPSGPGGVVIHPGSGSKKKNWPLDRFASLARKLEADGAAVTWLLGPAEEGWSVPPGTRIHREASLPRVASMLAGADLFIGNDSGTAHLAAAAGCSTIALFLASNPAVWAPRGKRTIVVDGQGTAPDAATVYAHARALMTLAGWDRPAGATS